MEWNRFLPTPHNEMNYELPPLSGPGQHSTLLPSVVKHAVRELFSSQNRKALAAPYRVGRKNRIAFPTEITGSLQENCSPIAPAWSSIPTVAPWPVPRPSARLYW